MPYLGRELGNRKTANQVIFLQLVGLILFSYYTFFAMFPLQYGLTPNMHPPSSFQQWDQPALVDVYRSRLSKAAQRDSYNVISPSL